MARDTYRLKLYRAEQAAERRLRREGLTDVVEPLSDYEVGELVRLVCVAADAESIVTRLVADQPKARFDHETRELVLPPWARCQLVILHHLAHVLVHPNFPCHGAEFVENQLELLGEYASAPAAEYLREAYEYEGLQVAAGPKQARRFLPYGKKMCARGKGQPIQLITSAAEVFVGHLRDLDTTHGSVTLDDRTFRLSDVRYASWAT